MQQSMKQKEEIAKGPFRNRHLYVGNYLPGRLATPRLMTWYETINFSGVEGEDVQS